LSNKNESATVAKNENFYELNKAIAKCRLQKEKKQNHMMIGELKLGSDLSSITGVDIYK